MDIKKIQAAITVARNEVRTTYRATVEAGEKDSLQLNGIRKLSDTGVLLDKALARVQEAADKTVAKVKEDKKAAKK